MKNYKALICVFTLGAGNIITAKDVDLKRILFTDAYHSANEIERVLHDDKAAMANLSEVQEVYYIDILPNIEVLEALAGISESQANSLGRKLDASAGKVHDVQRLALQAQVELWDDIAQAANHWIQEILEHVPQERLQDLKEQALNKLEGLQDDINKLGSMLTLDSKGQQAARQKPQQFMGLQQAQQSMPPQPTPPPNLAFQQGFGAPAGPMLPPAPALPRPATGAIPKIPPRNP